MSGYFMFFMYKKIMSPVFLNKKYQMKKSRKASSFLCWKRLTRGCSCVSCVNCVSCVPSKNCGPVVRGRGHGVNQRGICCYVGWVLVLLLQHFCLEQHLKLLLLQLSHSRDLYTGGFIDLNAWWFWKQFMLTA